LKHPIETDEQGLKQKTLAAEGVVLSHAAMVCTFCAWAVWPTNDATTANVKMRSRFATSVRPRQAFTAEATWV
ncbi:hypothetical protein, partial [Hallella sp.]|uniref:hypothetical protein n=1 Tax=Hallella sp. TaxID=2980186 RepID=UPI00307CABFA